MCAAIIHENISLELGYYNEGRLRLIRVVFFFVLLEMSLYGILLMFPTYTLKANNISVLNDFFCEFHLLSQSFYRRFCGLESTL